ncbi:C5a anaphylatoxin chemotactic receptor 1-like [Clarias gariepinus]
MDYDYTDYNISFDSINFTDPCGGVKNCTLFEKTDDVIGWRHWFALISYSIVFLLGVPGNGLVVWVTAFKMPTSVNAVWFLNLALTDLLCCLSLPLLMVPLAQDHHWPFGPLACKMLYGLLYMVMYCSVLILTVISLDRWILVSRPAWCQNRRRPRLARWICLGTWMLALVGSIPQFIHMEERLSGTKLMCRGHYANMTHAWAMVVTRFLLGFLLPFLIISYSHWLVYQRTHQTSARRQSERSARTVRVILAIVITFFFCWIPLHIIDTIALSLPYSMDETSVKLSLAQVLALCLAYFNSCLNPLLYVCLGRGFKESFTKTLKSVLNFASEEPTRGVSISITKSTTDTNY